MGINYFFNDYSQLCDRWILADNSKVPFRVIAEGGKERPLSIKDRETYEIVRAIASAEEDR